MVKMVTCIKRKPGMSVEAFQEYWRTKHADIVLNLPGMRKYVQSHTLLSAYRKGEPVHDGIAEIWFDDTRAMKFLATAPEYRAVQRDEPNFIDTRTMASIITEEHVVKDGPIPPEGVKNVEFVIHRPGMAIDEFQRHWLEVHGPLGAAIPVVRRYVQSHTRRAIYDSGRTPAYDGVALTWFDDTQAMRVSAASPEYRSVVADESNFLGPGPVPFIITKEHVIMA